MLKYNNRWQTTHFLIDLWSPFPCTVILYFVTQSLLQISATEEGTYIWNILELSAFDPLYITGLEILWVQSPVNKLLGIDPTAHL